MFGALAPTAKVPSCKCGESDYHRAKLTYLQPMDTSAFDHTTAAYARNQEASAFIVASLVRGKFGAIASEPDFMIGYLEPRKSIHKSLFPLITKAATSAGTTSDSTWGGPLAQPSARAFLGLVERKSPLGAIEPISVSGQVTGTLQVTGGSATSAGEQTSKPVSALSFSSAPLRPLKLISQVVVSEELAELSVPDALNILQRSLVSVTAGAEATKLFSTDAAVSGVSPAGLLAGVTPITSSSDFATDVGQALAGLSGGEPGRPVLVVSFQTAVRLMTMLRDLRELGVKIVISAAAGSKIIGVDADGLLVSTGGVEIVSGQPDLQMNDSPDSPPTAATVLISTWQRDLVALKVERWINWTARAGAVATLTLT